MAILTILFGAAIGCRLGGLHCSGSARTDEGEVSSHPRQGAGEMNLDRPEGALCGHQEHEALRVSATKRRVFPQGLCHSRLPPCATGFPTVQDVWSYS